MKTVWEKLEEDAKNEKDNRIKYYKELAEELLKVSAFYTTDSTSKKNYYRKLLLESYLKIFEDANIILIWAHITKKDDKEIFVENGDGYRYTLDQYDVIIPKNKDYWPDILEDCKVNVLIFKK